MGFVIDFLQGAVKSIPTILTKIATVLLGLFTFGLFIGYALAIYGFQPQYLLIPVIAMLVMWYKLDEGFLFLILLMLAAIFYPSALGL